MSAPGVSVARIDELEEVETDFPGRWHPVRHPMGIQAFGANAWTGDAGEDVIEEHDENTDGAGHEELYLVFRGAARFTVAGDAIEAAAGTLIAIPDPAVRRSAVADEDGTIVFAVGAPRGKAYEVADWEARRLS
jgi:quercetin dioxygenase-like cupin family protein